MDAPEPVNILRQHHAKRLLIVRLGSMGDIIHTLPAVTALRQANPECEIGWLIEEKWAELLCTLPVPRSGPRSPARPLVDRIHTVNTKAWRKSLFSTQTWERVAATISEVRAQRYHIAVDFQGAVRSALMARCSGAPTIYGFAQPRENVASMFYTRPVIARGVHIVEQNLSLAAAVAGRTLQPGAIELPRDEAIERRCAERLQDRGIRDFILMNPGAGWRAKQWPPERYGIVSHALAELGPKTLVNFAPGEQNLAEAVEKASQGTVEKIAGSITELIAFTRRTQLFIGGDTGPMHLAAALGIPVVAIFGPTDPSRNGPFRTRSVVLRSPSSRTSYSHKSQLDGGLLDINPEPVIAAARELLETLRG